MIVECHERLRDWSRHEPRALFVVNKHLRPHSSHRGRNDGFINPPPQECRARPLPAAK